jgi:protein-tyrosine-phosphatase/DNA-binding HxlR family transcriptional regulator
VDAASLQDRARRFAALGDPIRLAIVDELSRSDRSTSELQRVTGLATNLLAYHLDILERAGLVTRCTSSGDRRRRYLCLLPEAFGALPPAGAVPRRRALFICTRNAARSQLAAALWRQVIGTPAASAGVDPAPRVHPGAVAAARRAGLDLGDARTRHLDEIGRLPPLVVTVCDRAHENLDPEPDWLHWSIDDPVVTGTARAFNDTVAQLRRRITSLTTT